VRAARRVPGAVVVLGVASLLTDLSSEMIYPLLPAFLAALGAGPGVLGLMEGLGEATAAAFKLLAGRWTDRLRRRKPLVLAGYALAGGARPLIGLARIWPAVLGLRFLDRVGKGLRTPPRDALIADVTAPSARGAAFGLHRALDHAGAVLGPLAAALLLALGAEAREVMLLSAVPAALVLVVLVRGVREGGGAPPPPPPSPAPLGAPFRRLLAALGVFTLARSTDAFLLLRLQHAGVALADVALLWSLHSLLRAVAAWGGGRLADRIGARAALLLAWGWFAAVYAGLAVAPGAGGTIALFLAFALHPGLAEPAERAWVAALAPAGRRGAGYGLVHAAVGLGALPGGVLFGAAWAAWGPGPAFLAAAGLACVAALLLLRVPQS